MHTYGGKDSATNINLKGSIVCNVLTQVLWCIGVYSYLLLVVLHHSPINFVQYHPRMSHPAGRNATGLKTSDTHNNVLQITF
jgi:hypothetical protein